MRLTGPMKKQIVQTLRAFKSSSEPLYKFPIGRNDYIIGFYDNVKNHSKCVGEPTKIWKQDMSIFQTMYLSSVMEMVILNTIECYEDKYGEFYSEPSVDVPTDERRDEWGFVCSDDYDDIEGTCNKPIDIFESESK